MTMDLPQSLVLKIGGAAGLDGAGLVAELAHRHVPGQRTVLVHGGSAETNALAERLGQEPEFLVSPSGQTSRATDRATLEIFARATALVNRRLVETLRAAGVDAFGLSGLDGGAVTARRKPAIRVREGERVRVVRDQWTGRVTETRTEVFEALWAIGALPVVAPLAGSPAGEMLNVDGDRMAARLAVDLRAEALLVLSNVPGLLRDPDDASLLVEQVPPDAHEQAMAWAEGRMRKKVLAATEALAGGVQRVVLGDGRIDRPIARALAGAGTTFWNAVEEVAS